MKKVFLILVFGLLFALTGEAQFAKPLKSHNDTYHDTHPFSIGVTGSFAANDMLYTAVSESRLTPFLAPTCGVAAEWNVMNGFAIGLDASYAMRGTKEALASEFLTSFTSTDVARVNYSLAMNGVEVRLPFTYYLGSAENVKPYFYLAPRFDLWLNGNVRWERTYDKESFAPLVYEKELDSASLAPYDLGVVAGLGFCSRIKVNRAQFFVKFDLSYGIGLLNNFSQHEIDGDVLFQGWGDIEHETLGKRRFHNVEARLTLLIPLRKPLKDACSFDQRMRKNK